VLFQKVNRGKIRLFVKKSKAYIAIFLTELCLQVPGNTMMAWPQFTTLLILESGTFFLYYFYHILMVSHWIFWRHPSGSWSLQWKVFSLACRIKQSSYRNNIFTQGL